MEMAVQDHILSDSTTCIKLDLHLKDSRGNPARATTSAIYEHNNDFSAGSEIITTLSDSLRSVDSEVEHRKSFPSLSSLSDPKTAIKEELKKLKRKSNIVFIIFQFSLESAVLLFEKAKQMGMME
ncbi:hypothetical protein L484_009558 [Morus notabilis]|uniref:Receptor ligand binding region domain-containing protein n=1 Tax=Morus notabilis TaxID=981085 RepID=W9SHZ2_9ROSA|nr:hypothetical protein L484_009558 [Morus notabilis]